MRYDISDVAHIDPRPQSWHFINCSRSSCGSPPRRLDDLARHEPRTVSDSYWIDGRLRIMTVHKAKGLEFPVVILADPTCSETSSTPSRHVDPQRRLSLGGSRAALQLPS